MPYDPLNEDPVPCDPDFPADVAGFVIPSRTGEKMSACLFRPQGRGPHPTVLLLHGYPGDENNYDLAHAYQRAGYTVVVFHYRGTWGSEGRFSLNHVLEDVEDALRFLRRNSGEKPYGFDAQRLVLTGHSMGGFAALQTAARDGGLLGVAAIAAFDFSLAASVPEIRAAARGEFGDCLPIKTVGLDDLMGEIDRNASVWSFPALAKSLSALPVLLVSASRDVISVPEYHFQPLYSTLRGLHAKGLSAVSFRDGHCLSANRIGLARTLLSWTAGLPAARPDDFCGGRLTKAETRNIICKHIEKL